MTNTGVRDLVAPVAIDGEKAKVFATALRELANRSLTGLRAKEESLLKDVADLIDPPAPSEPKYGIWNDSESCFVIDAYNARLSFASREDAARRSKEWNDEDAEDWVSQTGRGCFSARKLPVTP